MNIKGLLSALKMIPLEILIGTKFMFAKRRERHVSFNALFSILGIFCAVCSLIVVLSVMDGFGTELRERIIGIGSHIQISKFGDENDYTKTYKLIKNQENVKGAAPFVLRQAMYTYGKDVNLITVQGVDQNQENNVSNINKYIVEGSFKLNRKGVVIGKQAAKQYGIGIGNTISLFAPGNFKPIEYKVVGIFYSGVYLYDLNIMFMDIGQAQQLFGMGSNITGFKVTIKDPYKVIDAQNKLRNLLGINYDVNSWMDLNKSLIGALKIERRMMSIIMSIMIIIAAFNISSTLIMLVLAKRKEIGVLRSLGFSKKGIKRIFISQGLILAQIGGLIGIVIGIILSLYINNILSFVEYFTRYKMFPEDIYYFDKVPVFIRTSNIFMIYIFTLIISLIASYYPANKAANLDPVEALKSE